MSDIKYNFPVTRFTEENIPETQLKHLDSEIAEANYEYIVKDRQSGLNECVDIVHSAETLLRILVKEHGKARVLKAIEEVVKKNRNRGYYISEG